MLPNEARVIKKVSLGAENILRSFRVLAIKTIAFLRWSTFLSRLCLIYLRENLTRYAKGCDVVFIRVIKCHKSMT